MSNYIDFASFYDRLMSDCDYDARCAYILKLFDRFGNKPKLMLDLACGTGNFTYRMIIKGIDVIGVDMSAEMLEQREPVLKEVVELMAVKDKYDLDIPVSDSIYKHRL